MTRATPMWCSTLIALGTVFVWGCASEPRTGETQQAAETQQTAPAAHPEQALLEDLVLANRMLAREADILDIQGHVTARSRVNPNHYYIARFLSPGGVTTSDFIENDLDSNSVNGPRNDQAREIYLHGEIYKARPDVMAVVHAHTPEFVAFGMSSVPLWSSQNMLPVWDIRPFNRGRNGVVSTPALGKAMAEKLGRSEAVLLWGHGIALTGGSLAEAISRVIDLRESARLQQAAISMGSAWKPQVSTASDDANKRTWDYLKQVDLKDVGGRVPTTPAPTPPKPADAVELAKRDVMLASRILASDELSILGTSGHVSVRNPSNASRYFVAPAIVAGAVTARDVIERDTANPGPDTQGLSIDDEIYKANANVMAVLYARTPEVLPFSDGSVKLRPVVNGGAFIGDGLPVFNPATLEPGQPLLANPALGRGVAAAMGSKPGALLAGHGFVLTARSIYNLVDNAYQLRQNAKIQQQAIALRGKVTHLNDLPVQPEPANEGGRGGRGAQAAPLGPPEGRSWIYWSQNVSLE
jgi:ribulose-5-phosphate 4-epimerase/fuculose-1-phosphate aldolase